MNCKEKKQFCVSDEEICAALIKCRTLSEAADACGISTRTLYDRMRSREFRLVYAHARGQVLRFALSDLNNRITSAIETISNIMLDETAEPRDRLAAASMILESAAKFSDRLKMSENEAVSLQTCDSDFF